VKAYIASRRLVLCAAAFVLAASPIITATPLLAAGPSAWASLTGLSLQQQEVTTLPDRTENELCTTQTFPVSVVEQGVPLTRTGSSCMVQTNFGVLGQDMLVLGTSRSALQLEAPGTPILVPHTSTLFVTADSGFAGRYIRLYDHPIAQFSKQISNNSWGVAYKAVASPDWTVADAASRPLQTDAWAASANGEWLVFRSATKLVRMNIASRQLLAFTAELPPYSTKPSLQPNLGISNDGRYVAYSGANTNKFLMFDLDGCSAQNDNSLTVPGGCGRLDLTDYMRAQVPQYRDSRYFAFSNEGSQLNLYNTAADGTKLYSAQLTSSVYTPPAAISYLGLGDSFSSGEGEIDNAFYLPGTDSNGVTQPGINTLSERCHISSRSYPFLLKQQMGVSDDNTANVACSGAIMSDVLNMGSDYNGQFRSLRSLSKEAKQDAKLDAVNRFVAGREAQIAFVAKYKPGAVTLTIGGNDLGFAAKLQECATSATTCSYATASQDRANMGQEIRSQFEPLKRLYAELRHASPETKIYVVGYPQFIADPTDTPICTEASAGAIDNVERTFIRQSVGYFNSVIQAAANATHVTYVDIEDSLSGKGICDGAGTSAAVNGIEFGNDIFGLLGNESYHPNPIGHSIIAETIRQQVGNLLNYSCEPDCPAVPTTVPQLPIYFLIDGSALVIPKATQLTPTQKLQNGVPTSLQIRGSNLAPNTLVTFSLHSNPIDLGSTMTDANGDFSLTPSMPSDLPSGIHTIHALGIAPSGETVDLYQPIYVTERADEPAPAPTPIPDPTPTPTPAPTPQHPVISKIARLITTMLRIIRTIIWH
jgi:hypothetical protein